MPIDDKTLYFAQQHPAPTRMVCSGIFQLTASGGPRPSQVVFSTMGTGVTRKLAIITNFGANNTNLHVCDLSGKTGGIVWPQTQFILETDDNFIISCSDPNTGGTFAVVELMLADDVTNAARLIGAGTRT